MATDIFETIIAAPFTSVIAVVAVSLLLLFFLRGQRRMFSVNCELPLVPKVPGLPLLGNLLQLKEKKPYKAFTNWAEIYGPVYSIQLGSSHAIVLSNAEVAKEAMVARFPAISTRKLSNALTTLTYDKCMVATSDYNDFHKTVKKLILNCLLGANAQKRIRSIRESMLENVVDRFNTHVKSTTLEAVNFLEIFESELFGLSLKQGAIEVDWRDFFPYLKWVPGNQVEANMRKLDIRRKAVMKSPLREHKKRVEEGKETNSYIDFLLSEASTMKEDQLVMLLWEPIIESSDTTLVTTEWAIFELGKDPERQNRLYQEIQTVCGSDKVTEDHLSQLPYLSAIFHETLRKHSPVPIVPIRYVHEDTQIGGYHIPAGSEIIINLYGCSRDKTQWKNPEEWNPERFLDNRYDPHDLHKTMAFGAGKRVCAGALQAMLISCTSIGRLVQEFQWTVQPGEEDDVDTLGLTTHKLHPLQAIVKPRSQT